VQAIKPPANLAEQLPQARQLLLQNQADSTFDGLLAYLQKNIKQKQGAQKVDNGGQ
jgi:peptidyl-prolyl cis-trans isomerase D